MSAYTEEDERNDNSGRIWTTPEPKSDLQSRLMARRAHDAASRLRSGSLRNPDGPEAAKAIRVLAAALERQADNIAFLLSYADVGKRYEKFTAELAEDRQALSLNKEGKS